jgi:hypothetical protein
MRWQSRLRTTRWGVVIGTLMAFAAGMVIAAPGSAAGAEKVYETQFTAQCVLAPAVLNEPGPVEFAVRGEAPEHVSSGEEFSLHNEKITFKIPQRWSEEFFALGVRQIRGRIVRFSLVTENGTPSKVNAGEPPEFPSGAPFQGRVENGQREFSAPSEGTLVSPPVRPNGSGHFRVTVDPTPGFKEKAPGEFESTKEGIQLELNGYSEPEPGKFEKIIGPLEVSCTAPAGVVVAEPIEGPPPDTRCTLGLPEPSSVEPNHGPAVGNTTVTIKGCNFINVKSVRFGSAEAHIVSVSSPSSITATTPAASGIGSLPASVKVVVTTTAGTSGEEVLFTYELPPPPSEFFRRWGISGSLTPKKLGQLINLPASSELDGKVTLNSETGAGKLTGALAIPPFTASLKLFGVLPVSLGVGLGSASALEGTIAKNESGSEVLNMPAQLRMTINSVGFLGLNLPVNCAAAEPLSLALSSVVTRAQLLEGSWGFNGSTTLPHFTCQGSFGPLIGTLLSVLLSGPENPYSLSFRVVGE